MRARDLHLDELLDADETSGRIRFGGQRALLLDAAAMGFLRCELIDGLGLECARALLTRFGYVHGRQTAQRLRGAFPWDAEADWREAGGRLHHLQGLVGFERPAEAATEFAAARWRDSYEAEQHLARYGRAEEPVCWSLCGFASGYMSFCHDREIRCLEVRCRARGDADCLMIGRPIEAWDDETRAGFVEVGGAELTEEIDRIGRKLREAEDHLSASRRRSASEEDEPVPGLIARSEAMRRVLELARRVAAVDATVLLTGETGTGKERVARAIHDQSPRRAERFVAIDCGALSETLLESELFGHRRGAFTGADRDRVGLLESAHGGTVLLDEIGEMPAATQVKLLRVLQEREVRRLGENEPRAVDLRILAATHRDLARAVGDGSFREDLYYRLRVVEIELPPLRARRDDVLPLARRFVAEAALRMGRPEVAGLSPEAAERLLGHSWPGNVRELQNAMERGVALAHGDRVDAADLPPEVAEPRADAPGGAPIESLRQAERRTILAALEHTGGNRARAAELLGIGAATLYRRLKEWGMTGDVDD